MARIRSTQKLPTVVAPGVRRVSPRATASATPIPAAAETKFCQASPAICAR